MVYFQGRPQYVPRPYLVRVLMRLSGAQSPFARSGCYPSRRSVLRLVSRHYPTFIAHTNSCANPKPSSCLSFTLEHKVFAGCGQPLLGVGPSRRYLRESFSACLDPYPGCSYGAFTRFFPQDFGLPDVRNRSALGNTLTIATSVWTSFRGCSHSLMFRPADLLATQIAPTVALSCQAAMAFTSEQNTSRYLLVHRIY